LYLTEREMHPSGARPILEAIRAYSDRGWHVDLLRGHDELPANAEPITDYIFPNVTFYGERVVYPWPISGRMPIGNTLRRWRFCYGFTRTVVHRALRLAQSQRYDVICGYEMFGAIAAKRLAPRLRLPVVTRYQGTVVLPHLDRPRPLLWWSYGTQILALRCPGDLTIMTNDGTGGDEALHRLRSPVKDLRFWINGSNPVPRVHRQEAAAQRAALGLAPDDRVVLTVSRLAIWKRVDRAIAALAKLDGNRDNVHLVIIGQGAMAAPWKALAAELGIADRVHFVGWVAHEGLGPYYAMADIFLTLYDLSNMGNPLFEAMRHGRPIITLDVGATATIITDGENGMLVPADPDPVPEVARRLQRLLDDAELRGRLGRAAARFAEQNFWTWSERANAEVDAVEELAARHHKSREAT